jgi:hypothetical protein
MQHLHAKPPESASEFPYHYACIPYHFNPRNPKLIRGVDICRQKSVFPFGGEKRFFISFGSDGFSDVRRPFPESYQ